MSANRICLVRAALLLAFAALIAKLLVTGEVGKYMAPTLNPLTAATGVVLAGMGVVELLRRTDPPNRHAPEPGPDHSTDEVLTYLIVVVPLALGLLVTPRTLGASALGGDHIVPLLLTFPASPPPASAASSTPDSRIEDVAQLVASVRRGDPTRGRRVYARGMVMRSDSLAAQEFALLRYFITHCAADARPVALLVIAPGDPGLPSGQWVEVEGVVSGQEREGSALVSIKADRVVPIEEPADAYL
jgi:putative membrane protein